MVPLEHSKGASTRRFSERRNSTESSDGSGPPSRVNLAEDREWEDVESDTEQSSFLSLVDDERFSRLEDMFEHVKAKVFIDVPAICETFELGFLETVKLINYLRSESQRGNVRPDVSSKDCFSDNQYLHPTVEDDAVLYSLDDLEHLRPSEPAIHEHNDLQEVRSVDADQSAFRNRFEKSGVTEENGSASFSRRDLKTVAEDSGSSSFRTEGQTTPSAGDAQYFGNYGLEDIHETMIKDRVRTGAYNKFIHDNRDHLEGKLVLDVGCGTGILSLMCARAGARRVVAVDNARIIETAKEIAKDNGYADTIIFIRGDLDSMDLELGPFDVIVSEWMGYGLLNEGMLNTVLATRDKYLASAGLMAPSHISVHLAPVSDATFMAEHGTSWHDVYGFNFNRFLPGYADAWHLPVPAGALCADPPGAARFDVGRMRLDDILGHRTAFRAALTRAAPDGLHGFALWFDTYFTRNGLLPRRVASAEDPAAADEARGAVAFTTGPRGRLTHWEQTFLPIERKGEAAPLAEGQVVAGWFGYERVKGHPRAVNIVVQWEVEGTDEKGERTWLLS